MYITGNISAYIKQYLSGFGDEVSDGQIFILLPGILIVWTIVFPFGGIVSKLYDPRL